MNINLELSQPSAHDHEIFADVMSKYGKIAKLVGVRYERDGNFTNAIVAVRPLTNSRYGGTVLGVGSAKKRADEPPSTIKGHSFALSRALRRIIEQL